MAKQKKFFETPDFNKQQSEWYKKLKEDGFRDTETIRDIKNNNINQQVITVNYEWEVYNDECRAYLLSGKITNELDLFIFEKHCDGISERETARMLNDVGYKIIYSTVRRRLMKILEDAEIERIVFKI